MNWRHAALIVLALSLGVLLPVSCQSAAPQSGEELVKSTPAQLETAPLVDESGDTESVEADSTSLETASSVVLADEPISVALPATLELMLTGIDDYRLEVSVSFVGQDASGTAVAFETVSEETVIGEPPGNRLDLATSGGWEQGGPESMSLLRFGDQAYLYVPEVGCVSGEAEKIAGDMRLPVDPRDVVEGLAADRVVAEGIVVNGYHTTELQVDGDSLSWPPSGSWAVSGAIFVQNGSDFITRVTMTLEGQGDLMGDGRTLTGKYELVINIIPAVAEEAAVLPDACRHSSLYPVTPDAYDVTVIEDLLAFKSRAPLDDVVDFYMTEMPAAGWQPTSEPDVFEDLAILNFERGDASLIIALEAENETGIVSVLISP